jgi:PmbA protein
MKNKKNGKTKDSRLLKICGDTAVRIGRQNVDEFEIFSAGLVTTEIEIFNGKVETLSFSDSIGLGIRIFKDRSVGYAYTSVLDSKSIEDCIEKAVSNSRITKKEDYNYLPRKEEFKFKEKLIDDSVLFREDMLKLDTRDKIAMAKKLETLTKSKDKRIVSINNVIYSDGIYETAILNSAGLSDKYRATSCFVYVAAISRQGKDTSTGDFFDYGRSASDMDLEKVAKTAARRSVSVLGAKKIKSGRVDLLLDPVVSSQFLGIIAGSLTADTVQKGKSLFKGQIGQKIFSIDVDVFDDGTLPSGLASKPFDGEGVTKGKTCVFEKGYLKTYLYNTYTARRDKTLSTGNAVRASYRSTPVVGTSNFYLKPSNTGFDELLAGIDKGFYVMDIIGLHSGVNPISGQMSVGAKGIWIEKGSLKHPVKEVTIATDIMSFCRSIKKVGKDLLFLPWGGYTGCPSMVVKDIMVGGR